MNVAVMVTNNGSEPVIDRAFGDEYVFAPGETVRVPLEAAAHMFGFDGTRPNFSHMARRWGYARPGMTCPDFGAIWRFDPVVVQEIISPMPGMDDLDMSEGPHAPDPPRKEFDRAAAMRDRWARRRAEQQHDSTE